MAETLISELITSAFFQPISFLKMMVFSKYWQGIGWQYFFWKGVYINFNIDIKQEIAAVSLLSGDIATGKGKSAEEEQEKNIGLKKRSFFSYGFFLHSHFILMSERLKQAEWDGNPCWKLKLRKSHFLCPREHRKELKWESEAKMHNTVHTVDFLFFYGAQFPQSKTR